MTVRVEDVSEASDLGRRVAARRKELNLTIEQVAERAGMAPGYLEYVEQDPSARPTVEALIKLSRGLEISTAELVGGQQGRALGHERAATDPVLIELDRKQCEALIRGGGIGRAIFRTSEHPIALPVNFKMLDGDVVFRSTERGSISGISPEEPVSFEVDRIDDAMSDGWSVLAFGTIHGVQDPIQLGRVEALGIEPWAGGERSAYFALEVTALSGRSIVPRHPGVGPHEGK